MGKGIENQDRSAPVALCRLGDKHQGVSEAIELCDGFKDLDPGMSVMIKPNLVAWLDRYPYAPYGVITSSRVLEEIIIMLKDHGVKNISLGDGCAQNKDMGSTTEKLFAGLGYDLFKKKYGVKLIDFNADANEELTFGPHTLKVSKEIIASDYLINVPALKTHELTRVTLGFKNLKGCLQLKSKQSCHNPHNTVDDYVVHIAEKLYPNLTVIDGTYMLENGPMYTGFAKRSELILAGRDMFSVDVVGANLMGVPVADVKHLTGFAKMNDRSLDVKDINVVGENPDDHKQTLEIDTPYSDDGRKPIAFLKKNLEGFDLPFPIGVCTGCTYVFSPAMVLILSAIKDSPFGDLELLAKGAKPSGNAKKTFLLGKCPIKEYKDDENLQEIVKIPGCPPKVDDVVKILKEHGVNVHPAAVDGFFGYLAKRYEKFNYPKNEYWLESA